MKRTHSMLFGILALVLGVLPVLLVAQPMEQYLNLLSRHRQSPYAFNQGAAIAVAYHPSDSLAVVADRAMNRLTIVDMSDPANPTVVHSLFVTAYGGQVSGVAVNASGLIAVTLTDATSVAANGKVLLLNSDGELHSQVAVGPAPVSPVFSPVGNRLLVCNRGIPTDNYAFNPNGSISIIDVADAENPVHNLVDFTHYNDKADSLSAIGVRKIATAASVAEDLEPVNGIWSPDGSLAWIALQKNNALAVVDAHEMLVERIVPLGRKDFSRGLPNVTTYHWTDRPVIGTIGDDQDILLGGFTGLWYVGQGASPSVHVFLAHAGRGPVAQKKLLRGQQRRPYLLPGYQHEIIRFEFDEATGLFNIVNRTPLFAQDGTTPISGMPNLRAAAQGIAYTDELAIDLDGVDLGNDMLGADFGGIVVAQDGSLWLADRQRPALYHFQPNGTLNNRYVPVGTGVSVGLPANAFGIEALPAVFAQRGAGNGFDALAIEGNLLYAFTRMPLDNPDVANDANSQKSFIARILVFNILTQQTVAQYVYPLYESKHGCNMITDAVALGDGRFAVIERDDNSGPSSRSYVMHADLRGATNIQPVVLPPGVALEALDFQALTTHGITPVRKWKEVYLPATGFAGVPEPAGLARISATKYALISDNGFGTSNSVLPTPPDGSCPVDADAHPVLGIVAFDKPNGLDPGDMDNGNFIANWSVYGLYQPRGIAIIPTSDGSYVLASANQGAPHVTTALDETTRFANVNLDPTRFPNAATLQQNSQLGRLIVSKAVGDLNGDGLFDVVYSFGGRSVSIWNQDGNLLWDSGSDMETRTSAWFPANFNAAATANDRDARSPHSGPEPCGVRATRMNDSSYIFVTLNQIGGVFMYNVTNPLSPYFVDYINSRTFDQAANTQAAGDLGQCHMEYIPSSQSPNSADLLLVAGSVSGTVAAYHPRIPRRLSHVPSADTSVCIGDTLVVRVQYTGPNLSYQWFKDGSPITPATSPGMTIPVDNFAVQGTYYCRVTSAGGMTLTSPLVTVMVYHRTMITEQPPALRQAAQNTTVNISLEATDQANEQFQWYRAGVALTNSQKFDGTNSHTLTIRSIQFADTSSYYYCIVTGGCSSERSTDVSVQIPRIMLTRQPQDTALCKGGTATLTIEANPTGGDSDLSYEWRLYNYALTDDGRITGSRTQQLVIRNIQLTDDGLYACVIRGVPSGATLYTVEVHVDIDEPPTIYQQPIGEKGTKTATVCDGNGFNLRLRAIASDISYQWFRNSAPIPGADQGVFKATKMGRHFCRVYSRCLNTFTDSDTIEMFFADRPVVDFQPLPLTQVRWGDAIRLEFTLLKGSPELSYQWYKNGDILPGATSASLVIPAAEYTDAGVYACRISNFCGITETQRAEVRVGKPVDVDDERTRSSDPHVYAAPNPGDDQTKVYYRVFSGESLAVELWNLSGTRLYSWSVGLPVVGSDVALTIPSGLRLSSGVYMVRLTQGATSVTSMLSYIKQ